MISKLKIVVWSGILLFTILFWGVVIPLLFGLIKFVINTYLQ